MGLDIEYIDGQTPLEEDEKEELLISTIATRGELDEFEQQNIEQAIQWTLNRTFKKEKILTEKFIRDLHRRMYGNVWKWAGEFRKTNKNLGVDKWQIAVELKNLLDDTIFWIENGTYGPEEIAIKFKHRLVSIHCFPNGNGRHSRLMAEIIIENVFKCPVFTWGEKSLVQKGDARKNYIEALREADAGKIEALIKFSRS